MPQFKLIKEEFSKVDDEWKWTYACLIEFQFNRKTITEITITDHYQLNHPEITNNSILKLLENLSGQRMRPRKKLTNEMFMCENELLMKIRNID